MPVSDKIIALPLAPAREKRKPRNLTSDGRRCVRVEAGTDPATGKRIRKAFYGKTLKEAQAKADEYKRAMADGVDVAAREQSVAYWIQSWLEIYGSKGAPGTVRNHALRAGRLSAAIGELKLQDVRQVHIQRYADSLAHLSRGTVNGHRVVAQQIFRAAVANRIITFDPTLGVTWQGHEDGSHRMLRRDEIAVITEHWPEHPMGASAMFMLYAGLRRGEALGLRWEDVDTSAGMIRVRQALQVQSDGNTFAPAPPKTRDSVRDIPILPVLASVIAGLPRGDGLVFPGFPTKSVFEHTFTTFETFLRRFLGPGFRLRPHDLRHTFASICYEAGVDVKTTQSMMGHSSVQITMEIYTHLSDELKASSVQSLANFTSQRFGHQMGIMWPEIP